MRRATVGRAALALAAVLSVVLAIGAAGCAGTYTTISPDEAMERLASSEPVFLLDVRTPEEYAEGHLAGSVLIPVQELGSRLSEIPTDRTIIVYCRSGNRSADAAGMLAGEGFSDVFNMGEGIRGWNGPIER